MTSTEHTKRKSIHVFDVDDTLMESSARVWVYSREVGVAPHALSPSQFSTYSLQKDENFDFREFSDIGILSRGVAIPYTRDILNHIVAHRSKSHFAILTARPEKKLHAPFLIRLFKNLFGIELHKDLVFTISDERYTRFKDKSQKYSDLSVAQKKAMVIADELISKGYNDISFYDDSRENLLRFSELKERFPDIIFKAHFIDPTWSRRLKEFQAGDTQEKILQKGLVSVKIILQYHYEGPMKLEACLQALERDECLLLNPSGIAIRSQNGKYVLTKIS
jgi:hypothetical protein